MKGKVGQAVSFCLPLVGTTVAIEGYNLIDGENCSIADDAKSFARAIVDRYCYPVTWERYSHAGAASIRNFVLEAVANRLRELFERVGVGVEPA